MQMFQKQQDLLLIMNLAKIAIIIQFSPISRDGQSENYIDFGHTLTYSNFYSNFNKIINENWQSFGDSYLIEQTIEDKTNAIVKLKFEPASFYEPYMFKFIMTNGEFVLTNAGK